MFACAAASLAIGTLNGEHETYDSPMLWQNSTDSGSPPCSPQIPNFILGLVCLPNVVAHCMSLPTPFWSTCANGSLAKIFLS